MITIQEYYYIRQQKLRQLFYPISLYLHNFYILYNYHYLRKCQIPKPI